jgi:hypothetical protein
MKRLIGVVVIALLLVMGSTAMAKLTGGDIATIKKLLAAYFDVTNADRGEAKVKLAEYLNTKNRVKELADVEQLAEILADAPVRENPSRLGVVETLDWSLKDLGITKFPYVVSLPKKYSGSVRSAPWPMIVCLPDKGEKAEDHMEKYWKSQAVRDQYVIVVLGYKYDDVRVTKQRTVTEEKGENDKVVRVEEYEEKVPFSWTNAPERKFALQRFWASVARFQMADYKIDPNRIILAGSGFGADGVLNYAIGSAWRFSGLVLTGGTSASAALPNVAHLPVLAYAAEAAGDESAKTHATLKTLLGDKYVAADASAEWGGGTAEGGAKLLEWLGTCVRNRYPLPSKWTKTDDAERTGYWLSINKTFTEEPAEATIAVAKGKIEITTVNVAQFDLYLNDLLVNLDKEFELIVNGENRGKFTRDRSPEQFISHLVSNSPRDLGCVFTAEMTELEVERPPAEDAPAADGDAKKDAGEGDGEKKDDAKKDDEKKDGN